MQYVSTEETLKDLFLQLEKPDAEFIPELQNAINASLSNLSEDEQIDIVAEQVSKPRVKSHLYYAAMAYTGTQEAMNQLVEEYKTSTEDQKQAAFEALATWKSFDVIYPLLDIARNSKDNREKNVAIDAIINTVVKSSQTQAVKYLFLREALEMTNNDKQKNSIIVELGNTKMYQALLLLEPYMDIPTLKENAALASMKLALDNPSFAGPKATSILKKVNKTLDSPDAGYQREAIKKHLNENSSEDGYVSLFNGKDLTGWKGLVGNPISRGKMSVKELITAQAKVDKQAAKNWLAKDGELFFTGEGNNLCTEKQYGDFEMLVDWKLYPGDEPDGGVYLRGTPQVQIWDISRTHVGAEVGSGGLYNNQTHENDPLKVADLKLGEWNYQEDVADGDNIKVILNGATILDGNIREASKNGTIDGKDHPGLLNKSGHIGFLGHGTVVKFKNIRVKEL